MFVEMWQVLPASCLAEHNVEWWLGHVKMPSKKVYLLLCVTRDVHGDMSAMVLSLRWSATSFNQALEMPIHTPPPKGKYRTPEQQAAAVRAQHRWRQIKLLHVDFYRARR